MRNYLKTLLPALMTVLAATQAHAAGSLRENLIAAPSAEAVYSIDEHSTLFRSSDRDKAIGDFKNICAAAGAAFSVSGNSLACEGIFDVSEGFGSGIEGQHPMFFVRSTEAQPLAYKNPALPSIDRVEAPSNGKIDGALSAADAYQYLYALCKKENGTSSVVVSKRFGKFARLTQVNAEEAFGHFLNSGMDKDPWYFACEGGSKFLVEKDYQYAPDSARKYSFYSNRGLEWIDYVKSGDIGKIALR